MSDANLDRHELAHRWSALHHGIDPAQVPLLAGWLRLMWGGGRLLARGRIPPTAVTASGVLVAGGAVVLAGRHPGIAGAAVVAAVVCDGLDGATAVVADRATRSGALADAVADRLCDGAFAAVLWRLGAPSGVVATAAALAWSVDTLRRVRRIPDRITVAERPTFTVCTALACASSAVRRHRSGRPDAPLRLNAPRARTARQQSADVWPCAAVWIGAGIAGVIQLMRTPVGSAAPAAVPADVPTAAHRVTGGPSSA